MKVLEIPTHRRSSFSHTAPESVGETLSKPLVHEAVGDGVYTRRHVGEQEEAGL